MTASPLRLRPFTVVAGGALALMLGNLGRIPLGTIGGRPAPLAVGDLLLIPLWLTLLVHARNTQRFALDAIGRTMLLFALVGVASLVNAALLWHLNLAGVAGPASFLLRWILYAGWYWLLTTTLDDTESDRAVVLTQRALLLIALFGIVQSALLPGFAQLVSWGGSDKQWDQQGRRLVSTLLDPNFAGVLIVIALLLEVARVVEQQPPRRVRFIVLSVAMLLTLSRSSLLACVLGYAVLLFVRGANRKLAGVTMLGAIAAIPFLAAYLQFAASFGKLGIDGSAAQRLIPWSRALRMLVDHPWLGVGFNAVGVAQQAYGWEPIGGAEVSFDGGLLFVAAMTGGVGLLVYVTLLTRVVGVCRDVWRRSVNPEHRALAAGTTAATSAVVVHSLFANSLLLPFVMQVLWILWGRVRVIQRALPVLVAAVLVSGCDPCSGVVGCSTAPRIGLAGQIVDPTSGAPIRGATVSVASAQSVTQSNGRWELSLPVREALLGSDSTFLVRVSAPGEQMYTVRLPARPITRGGDVQEVGRWNSRPFARFQGTLVRASGAPVVGANVSFIPTGGVPATFVTSEPSNDGGIFSLHLAGSGETGFAIGTLIVQHPSFAQPTRLEGFALPMSYEWTLPFPTGPFVIGGRMDYGGQVFVRGTGEQPAGARITFTRSGGVPLATNVVSTTSGPNGFFVLSLPNQALGTVIGDLRIEAVDGSRRSTYRGVRFESYDSTAIRYSRSWGFGFQWSYVAELFRRDRAVAAANVEVEFRQVAGPRLTPSVLTGRTDARGQIRWRADVLDSGVILGDVTVRLPDVPTRVIRAVALSSFDGDSLPFTGVIPFGPTMRVGGELFVRGTNQRAAGASISFARTGGVPLADSVVTAVADNTGFFELPLVAREDGVVTGTLTVASADGRQRSRYANRSFFSYDSTALRTIGSIGIGGRLAYALEFWRNDLFTPVPGVRVELRRTGGVEISPVVTEVVTDASGRVEWRPSVGDSGVVELEATVYPRTGPVRTVRNIRLSTFESDELRFAGIFGFGPAFRYVIEVKTPDDRLLAGARVTWTQTDGPLLTPSTVTGTTGPDGWLRLAPVPSDAGTIVGDIRIEPPAPWPAGSVFLIRGVSLPTREDADLRYALSYRLPPP